MLGQQRGVGLGPTLTSRIQGQVEGSFPGESCSRRVLRHRRSAANPPSHSPGEYKAGLPPSRALLGSRLANRGAFPGPEAGRRPLRELLPAGGATVGRPGDLDPVHDRSSARRSGIGQGVAVVQLVRSRRRRSDAGQGDVRGREASFPAAGYIAIGDASLTPGRAVGSVTTEQGEATWDLAFDDGADPFDHLQFGWMYRGGFPKTKVRSPYPSSTFSGVVTIGDRRMEIDGWPGMVGHNWGAEHAERWIWIDAVGSTAGTATSTSSPAGCCVAGRRPRGSRTASSRSTASATASAGSVAPAACGRRDGRVVRLLGRRLRHRRQRAHRVAGHRRRDMALRRPGRRQPRGAQRRDRRPRPDHRARRHHAPHHRARDRDLRAGPREPATGEAT